jgi:hypothetical protein
LYDVEQVTVVPTVLSAACVVPQTLHTTPKLLNLKEGVSTNIQIGAALGARHTSRKSAVNNNNNNNKCQQDDRGATEFLGTADS